jgi:hypothetical protein
MQEWEYKIVMRERGLVRSGSSGVGAYVAGEFHPTGEEMLAQLDALGRDGWELVSVTARQAMHSSPVSNEEVWIFKRPRRA